MNIIFDRYRIDTIVLMCFFFFFAKKTLIWQCTAYEIIGMPLGGMREGALSCHISSSPSNSPPYFSSTIDSTHLESMVTSPAYCYDPVDVSSCPTVVPEAQCSVPASRYDHAGVSSLWSCWHVIESYLCHTDVPLSQATVTALVRASTTVDESSDRSIVTITPPATRRIL